jgi:hypothetical protein
MCVADKDFDGRICFAFLETIRTKYNFALQNGGQDSFDGELGSQMVRYESSCAAFTLLIFSLDVLLVNDSRTCQSSTIRGCQIEASYVGGLDNIAAPQ